MTEAYQKIRSQIKPGDIFSFRGTGLIARIIQFFTFRNHVAGSISSKDLFKDEHGNVTDRKIIIEATQGEVNIRLLSSRICDYKGEIYWHRLKAGSDCFREAINDNLWSTVGVQYDYRGLFKNISRLIPIKANKLICSELLQFASFNGGPIRIAGKLENMLPGVPISTQKKFIRTAYSTELQKKLMEQVWAGKTLRPGALSLLPFYELEVKIK